jgi:uncharacterized membrane protein
MTDQVSITIDVPRERVWAVMSDVVNWPSWSPTVTSVRPLSGDPRQGADFELEQPRLAKAVWEIAVWDPPTRFEWVTKTMGMVTEAGHEVTASDGGSVVTLTVSRSGLITPIINVLYGRLTRDYMAQEAAALKARCEGRG